MPNIAVNLHSESLTESGDSMTQHTKTPWTTTLGTIYSNGDIVAILPVDKSDDARFIIRACNCHEEMLEALERCKTWHQGDKWREGAQEQQVEWGKHRDMIDNAIKKARGEL